MDQALTVQVFCVADESTWAITLPVGASVASLRLAAAEHDPIHDLRFLFNGRLLSSDALPLRDYGVTYGSRLLAVRVSLAEPAEDLARADEHAAYGFERLRETGFSEEDVREFRESFHGVHFGAGVLPDEGQMQREERWIRAQGAHNRNAAGLAETWLQPLSLPLRRSGVLDLWPISALPSSISFGGERRDTVLCLCLGFLVPWLPVVVWMMLSACEGGSRVPRATKAALAVGAMCNVTLGLVRSMSVEEDSK